MKNLLEWVQRILGSASYERYCEHLRKQGREAEIPTAEQFYLDSLKRRYAGVSRCC
jgi:uncharacterized short protein YbdD (DUF466 family)